MNERIVILARQSLTRAKSVSIPVQVDTMTEQCTTDKNAVVHILRSENTRGWQEDRDDLMTALKMAESGEFDVLMFWSLDRLARTVRQQEVIIHELAKRGVRILSHTESWADQPEMRQMAAIFNEKFSRDLSRRMSAVLRHHAQQGRHTGPPPLGFDRGEDDHLVINESQAKIIRRMFDLRLAGNGADSIADTIRTEFGYSTWPSTVVRTLQNPAMAGGVRNPSGSTVWGAHPAIIGRDEWDVVQALIATRRVAKRKKGSHWLEGLMFCGCGSPLYFVGSYSHAGDRRYAYRKYRCRRTLGTEMAAKGVCTNPVASISQRKVDETVPMLITNALMTLSSLQSDDVVNRLTIERHLSAPGWEKEAARLKKDRAKLLTRRARAVEMGLDMVITRDETKTRTGVIDAQIAEIDAQLSHGPAPVNVDDVRASLAMVKDVEHTIDVAVVFNPDAITPLLARLGARFVLRQAGTMSIEFTGVLADVWAVSGQV